MEAACADHGDQVALPAHLDPQHAEAVLGVVEGDPFDQPGQGLALRRGGQPRTTLDRARGALRLARSAPGARESAERRRSVPPSCRAEMAARPVRHKRGRLARARLRLSCDAVQLQAPAGWNHALQPVAHAGPRLPAVKRAEGKWHGWNRDPDRGARMQAGQEPVHRAVALRGAACGT